MRIYEKPCMIVTCYNAMDATNNLTLVTSMAVATYNKGNGISGESFKLHNLKS